MRTTRTIILLAFAVTAAPLLTAGQALADEKTYPATFCMPQGGVYNALSEMGDYSIDGISSFQSDGTVRNVSGSEWPENLICPFVRDLTGAGWQNIKVRVRDRHYDKDITCTAYSRSSDGAAVYWSSASTNGSSSLWQTLTLNGNPVWAADGTISMTCSLPGTYSGNSSAIASYTIDEG